MYFFLSKRSVIAKATAPSTLHFPSIYFLVFGAHPNSQELASQPVRPLQRFLTFRLNNIFWATRHLLQWRWCEWRQFEWLWSSDISSRDVGVSDVSDVGWVTYRQVTLVWVTSFQVTLVPRLTSVQVRLMWMTSAPVTLVEWLLFERCSCEWRMLQHWDVLYNDQNVGDV